jgi:hypothetical protein
MDEFHERLAQLRLVAVEQFGFVLAGGYAFHLHQITDRVSNDVDLFTDRFDAELFSHAEQALLDAYQRQGLRATVGLSLDVFRQINVVDPATGAEAVVDLGFDARDRPPVRLEVGPVLALEDVAVSKVRTLVDRQAARDFLDVHGLLTRGHFTATQLVEITRQADPNVTSDVLAAVLERSALPETEEYFAYGIEPDRQAAIHRDLAAAAASSTDDHEVICATRRACLPIPS